MIKRTLFFEKAAYLNLKDNQLVVSYPSDASESKTVPIEDIGIIVIESLQATITSALITACMQQGVGVIYCDQKHMPCGLLLPMEGHTEQTERIRVQLSASLPLKKNLWKQTISAKILNQAYLLQLGGYSSDNMKRWAREVVSGDAKNHEARAAVYYWSNIFPWKGFIRDQDGNYPNNLLNYGYAILRALTARCIISSGMLPMLGIFHKNKYNAFGLADDIMEPYRPFVDQIVLSLIEDYQTYQPLTKEVKVALLGILRKDVFMDGSRSPLMVAMSRTTSSLYDCFAGKSRKILYPSYVEQY